MTPNIKEKLFNYLVLDTQGVWTKLLFTSPTFFYKTRVSYYKLHSIKPYFGVGKGIVCGEIHYKTYSISTSFKQCALNAYLELHLYCNSKKIAITMIAN